MSAAPPRIGVLASGPRDALTDVAGVAVGHATIAAGAVQTGVTMIVPHPGNLFLEKVPASAAVLNGFGKTAGLMQLTELGVLESPIALTNTFAVGTVATALTRHALASTPEIGRTLATVNPVVGECNDGYLNDQAAFAVTQAHCEAALATAGAAFARGAVGAGRGMSCFELKGGIGSASRVAAQSGLTHTLGALVLANFGRIAQLTLAGRRIGPAIAKRLAGAPAACESGSIVVVLATDAPVDARQLRRIAFRAAAGIARTGSSFGHGSGDVVIAFSTAGRILERAPLTQTREILAEARLDRLFDAAVEATEQAIVDALFSAVTVAGRDGHTRRALLDIAPDWATLAA